MTLISSMSSFSFLDPLHHSHNYSIVYLCIFIYYNYIYIYIYIFKYFMDLSVGRSQLFQEFGQELAEVRCPLELECPTFLDSGCSTQPP